MSGIDFRSREERQRDEQAAQKEQQDYKQAFERADREIHSLKSRMEKLETENQELKQKFSQFINDQAEQFRQLRSHVETGVTRLDDDNKKLHSLIQSAQSQDLEVVNQMDQNHRQRLDGIVRLFDQRGLPNG